MFICKKPTKFWLIYFPSCPKMKLTMKGMLSYFLDMVYHIKVVFVCCKNGSPFTTPYICWNCSLRDWIYFHLKLTLDKVFIWNIFFCHCNCIVCCNMSIKFLNSIFDTLGYRFLNKVLSNFNLALDLDFLANAHKYTFFKPKLIFYATYLYEKIGYWRYITIYRHLRENPKYQVYPIFNYFENGW